MPVKSFLSIFARPPADGGPAASHKGEGLMLELMKALMLGAVLSAIVAIMVGSQGSNGGPLAIHALPIAEARIYWSWPLFVTGSGLAWALMLLQR